MTSENINKPNVLWIVVDCLRNDRCPTDQNPLSLKAWPKLRENGVCFTQALSSASTTTPSFSSMLTSLYYLAHGVYSTQGPPINPDVTRFPEILSNNGYSTNAFMTGPLLESLGLTKGFHKYQYRTRKETIYREWGKDFFESFEKIAKQQNPWFTMLHFFELHSPIQTEDNTNAPKHPEQRYNQAWQHLDKKIEQIISMVPDNTIVVLTADHGEVLIRRGHRSIKSYIKRKFRKLFNVYHRPDDWRYHGFFPFDELHRVPLCISGPGLPNNVVLNQQVRHIDIMPTLLELLRIDLPENIHGRSLMPMINGQKMSKEAAFLYTGRNDATRYWHAVRTETHKLIVPAGPLYTNNTIYLFDLINDPDENKNIAVEAVGPVCDLRIKLDSIVANMNRSNSNNAAVNPQEFSEEDKEDLEAKLKDLGYL